MGHLSREDDDIMKVSESYIVGIDISETDEPVIAVSKRIGTRLEFVNKITGEEAEELYEKLTNKKLKGGN